MKFMLHIALAHTHTQFINMSHEYILELRFSCIHTPTIEIISFIKPLCKKNALL